MTDCLINSLIIQGHTTYIYIFLYIYGVRCMIQKVKNEQILPHPWSL